MSSRHGAKTKAEKGRPKSSDKLRKKPGTPDKTTTPGTEANGEEEKKVIVNEEILRLAIKHEDLVKLRKEEKTPEPSLPLREISIRRERPEKEWKKPPSKRIAVAKEAPNDAPIRPYNLKDGAGPRFDHFGRIVPHSILGDAYSYQKNAICTGHWPDGAVIEYPVQEMKVKPDMKRERKIAFEEEEHKALDNWEKKMRERRRQQGYLSKLLNKKPENLVMNQADGYKKTQERRDLLDKALPLVEDGKGYRHKSEFWNQHEWFGGEETGIFAALSESQKGNHQPLEKVGVPRTVMREKGIDPLLPPSTPSSKPWHQTQYLKKRQEQLAELVREIDPYDPQFQTLEVIGSNKPVEIDRLELKSRETTFTRSENQMGDIDDILADADDPLAGIPDIPAPVQGPSIIIEGKQMNWEGDSHSKSDETALVARVVFECISGDRKTEMFEVKNNGSTAIYYNWNKIEKSNPFDQVNRKIQRFYFNTNGGVILPGDTKKFPIVFKSCNYGIFSETWQFQTHPVVAAGASIFVTLKGIALQVDKYEKERQELETMLTHKEAEETVGMILESILNGVRTPERPATPIDAYLTEAEEFKRKNPTLLYSSDTIEKLKLIYKDVLPPEEKEETAWDLRIDTIRQAILSIPEEEERKQDILSQFNQHIFALSLKPVTPISELLYQHAYSIICDMVDRISSTVSGVRQQLGLPDTETGDNISPTPRPLTRNKTELSSKPGTSEGKKQSAPSGGKKGAKEKPTKGGKEPRAQTKGATTPKSRSTDKIASSVGGTIISSPTPPTADPLLAIKYKERVYTQAYMVFYETIDRMTGIFEGVYETENQLNSNHCL